LARTYAVGYRYGEQQLDKINPIKDGTKISDPRPVDLRYRPVVQVSAGCHLKGAAMVHPCPHDPATIIAGVRHRFARRPPKSDPALLADLRVFVRSWIRRNLVPLSPNSDTSVETWLESTHYSRARKDELLKKWEEFTTLDDPSKKYRFCKSFMKDETYPKYKHARGINSRSDEFKCYMGPIFKLIENKLYKIHHFIKHVPVADRSKLIQETLYREGGRYVATDYTAFESLFVRELMDVCEFELYDYMTQALPEHDKFMKECWETLGGENICDYKTFVVRLLATRMSGEMCTSLGNGFSNLMFMLFMCERKGCKEVDGYVEGDDGIFSMIGEPPSSDDFAKLGLNIKMDIHDRLSTASFCGIIFDEGDCLNVTDPREVLASFGWTTSNYKCSKPNKLKMLLRAKSLSLAYQYPGCPIIASLARYGLRVTRSVSIERLLQKPSRMSMWEKEQLIEARQAFRDKKWEKMTAVEVPIATRLLVEQMYNIPINVQLDIEQYLDSLDDVQELDIPIVLDLVPQEWVHYYDNYCFDAPIRDPDLEYSSTIWNQLDGFVREW